MPIVFDEVVAEVVPERSARTDESRPEGGGAKEPDPRAIRREFRRIARRAGRLRAD